MELRALLGFRPHSRHIRRAILALIVVPLLTWSGEAVVRARIRPLAADGASVRVYARPFTLTRGDRPDRDAVLSQLHRLGYRRASGRDVGIGEYYFGSWGWVIGRRPFRGAGEVTPGGFAVVRLDYAGRASRIEDGEGNSLAGFALEPELIGRIGEQSARDRIPVELEDVPTHLLDALLTVEDQRFYQHHGLDFRRIGAAFMANFKAGRVVQGGSTLTQQLAKNLFLSPRRSVVRKVREAMMATVLEARYGKDEILQAYLNHIYLGQDGGAGIHGVGRAAQHFFGKDVAALDLPESALLVALIRAPSLYSPFRHQERARERRDLVLRLMLERGAIATDEFRSAAAAPLGIREPPAPIRSARYFVDFVAEALEERGPDGGSGPPRAVVTTMDPSLQRAAEQAVERGLARLERDFDWLGEGEEGMPLQAALVALSPATGEILAMVGGRDYGASQFNRAVNAHRQPGSAFKPVVALAALSRSEVGESGGPGEDRPAFTLASVLEDGPFQVETPVGLWQPVNYDRSYSGQVTLREALERSLNVPFARLGMAVGPERIVNTAHRMGIESHLNPFPSVALGASEVSPLELARAFAVLAAGGFRADLKGILTDRASGEQVFDPAETYLVTSALRGAVERGTGMGIRERGFYGEVAAKSGTTNDFRDGWFVGYTPSLVVAVWVGFDRGKRLELPGAALALPIFADFLREALGPDGERGPWGSDGFTYPWGLEMVEVDPYTGLRGGWGCQGEPELFLRGTAPNESCLGVRVGDRIRIDERTLNRLLEEGEEGLARLLRRLFRGEGRD